MHLRLNDFSMKVELERNGRTFILDDAVREELWLAIDERFKMRLSEDFFGKMLRKVAREHMHHPVRDYLTDLLWDGKPRIDTWLIDYAGAPDSPLHSSSVTPVLCRCRRPRAATRLQVR